MTAPVAALLQPMKDRLTAATPGCPWCQDRHPSHLTCESPNAPTDQAKLIAAIEAVVSLAVDDAPAGHHYLAALTQALGGDGA